MITLITAVPGSGKTLYAISLIVDALNKSRPVYTNINGLVKSKFPNNHLLYDAPDDWRDCPNGSYVVYDECQQPHLYPSNAQRGKVEDERLTALETHRHGGYDIVFITQAPTFVHHHVRKLVGEHVHLYRASGVSGASKYTWAHTCELPNDRSEQKRADFVLWKHNKDHYSYYTSAVMHTHKFKMPVKITILACFILLGVSYLIYNVVFNDGLSMPSSAVPASAGSEARPPSADLTLPPPSVAYNWSSAPAAVPVAGCIASESRGTCQCFSKDGVTLSMDHAACLSIIKSPLPRKFLSTSSDKSAPSS